jgi:hypothetical protein
LQQLAWGILISRERPESRAVANFLVRLATPILAISCSVGDGVRRK